jgi:hypothetical protein
MLRPVRMQTKLCRKVMVPSVRDAGGDKPEGDGVLKAGRKAG